MPLYQFDTGTLVPFQRLNPTADYYEKEVEDIAWTDLEVFTGQALFPIARQPRITGGGIPDILALDRDGSVVIVEVKRDVDRNQLAQALEYAGWARSTSLDEIASLYNVSEAHSGERAFFEDWKAFTETAQPMTLTRSPRLFLVAREFHGRTRSALAFLEENGVPVTLLPVTLHKSRDGMHIVHIDAEHEPAVRGSHAENSRSRSELTVAGRRVTITDLLDDGILEAGENVVFERPRLERSHQAVINEDGTFTTSDGLTWNSPSRAAQEAADMATCDGWSAWKVPRLNHQTLSQLRSNYISAHAAE